MGDLVLITQRHINKYLTKFHRNLMRIIEVWSIQIVMEDEQGKQHRHNSLLVKLLILFNGVRNKLTHQTSVVQRVDDAIHRIYLADSAIHHLNDWGLVPRVFPGFNNLVPRVLSRPAAMLKAEKTWERCCQSKVNSSLNFIQRPRN